MKEQADFDRRRAKLHQFDDKPGTGEFSDRGRADLKIRPNDSRFADNPMKDEQQLDEVVGQSKIERLHQMLTKAEISDQQIRGGVRLTKDGTTKVAARLGIGPNDVEMYLNSLVQQLRDADSESVETLTELYYDTVIAQGKINEESDQEHAKRIARQTATASKHVKKRLNADRVSKYNKAMDAWNAKSKRPFDKAEGDLQQEDRLSIEPDALGNATIRDANSGRETYLQGAAADEAITKSKKASDPDKALAPLAEALTDDKNFWDEINAESGTYNFIWKLPDRHGLGTVLFHADRPSLQLVDIRDIEGEKIEMDQASRQELLGQARDFLGNE